MSYLPSDMVTEILARLPVKSLIRCRLLSKEWFATIRSQKFVELHLHYSKRNDSSLLLYNGSRVVIKNEIQDMEEVQVPYFRGMEDSGIVCACNGLVIVVTTTLMSKDLWEDLLVLWNPATRKLKEIPLPISVTTDEKISWGEILYGVGVGVNDKCTDVRVVTFQRSSYSANKPPSSRGAVYCVNTGAWEKLEDDCVPAGSYDYPPVHVNGTVFWMGKIQRGTVGTDFILSFDLSKKVFSKVTKPSIRDEAKELTAIFMNRLVVYNDSLGMLTLRTLEPTLRELTFQNLNHAILGATFDLWVLKKESEEREIWMYAFTVELEEMIPRARERDTDVGLWEQNVILHPNYALHDAVVPCGFAPPFTSTSYFQTLLPVTNQL